DELIHAFYDQQVPADVHDARSFERWYRDEATRQPRLLVLSREELMRHEAAGITTQAFPKTVRLGGIDCAAEYRHEPGQSRDGITVTVPVYALNATSEERCEWLVPGMLREKVAALAKTLPQRSRSRLVPLPGFADAFVEAHAFGEGDLLDTLCADIAQRTGIAVRRGDFRQEQLAAHLSMNLRVVDEHGRQLGESRHLAELKAAWGEKALAALRLPQAAQASIGGSIESRASSASGNSSSVARSVPSAPSSSLHRAP